VSSLERYFNRLWYEQHWQQWLFWPASKLTETVVQRKRKNYERHPPKALSVPVVVIGNLTVGGTGKTPLLLHLIDAFASRGLKVGVISRGYGGKAHYPLWVTPDTPATASGDEPAMIARRARVPVVVDPDRARAAEYLLKRAEVDLLLSDDGLQHYRLQRQLEVLVIDGARGFGNEHLLPMGPLREPLARLASIRFAVVNGAPNAGLSQTLARFPALAVYPMHIQPGKIRRLAGSEVAEPAQFNVKPVTALAGIGNPSRFFNTLKSLGIRFDTAIFADHHHYSASELQPYQLSTVIMTEKDAVKIQPEWLADAWYLSVDANITGALADDIMRALSLQ